MPDEHKSSQADFHKWLRVPPPFGPGLGVELYSLKDDMNHKAFCRKCQHKIDLICPCCHGTDLQRKRQRGVDIGIVMHTMKNLDNYDTFLLSSGDGDFVELAVYQYGVDVELQSLANCVFSLDNFSDEIRK
ncbi:MAG: NYN domain-containing protein [Nitrospinae bacterium]|nr:NYN domain-containing protein [Nitrospinota bacterium]